MSDEERVVILLDKAEHGCLSLEEMRWLERWLGRQEERWPVQRLRSHELRARAPDRVRDRVLASLRAWKSASAGP